MISGLYRDYTYTYTYNSVPITTYTFPHHWTDEHDPFVPGAVIPANIFCEAHKILAVWTAPEPQAAI